MLTYVIGLAGSGKTTLCARFAHIYLRKHKNVYCNVPILGTRILDCNTDLGQVAINNGIVLIDEAAIEFNSRDYAKLSKYVNEFVRTHRHSYLDVYVFSQNYMGADKIFRDNCEQIILLRKSRIPHYSLLRVYLHDIVPPNGLNNEFADKYILLPLKTRLIRFGSFSNMFDSFEMPELPEKDWKIWESINRYSKNVEKLRKKPRIVERLTLIFSGARRVAGFSARLHDAIYALFHKKLLAKRLKPETQNTKTTTTNPTKQEETTSNNQNQEQTTTTYPTKQDETTSNNQNSLTLNNTKQNILLFSFE